ncbi:hypothetical protein MMYC01_205458 [Madurella mycetomatis]|uniref:Uncharacterized protein n=1 Tax=Madurella mycetomatis TaxID=100816 RepID=A0A175VZK3_9PEZI|nr:hypothetical protein MMYC01_205458 [Madurella mycetomatis]
MKHFSQASAAAACSDLVRTAQSAAAKVQAITIASTMADQALQKPLPLLLAGLQKFGEHSGQLGHCVADAAVVHPQLGDVLGPALVDCGNAMSILSDKLESENGELSTEAISRYQGFLSGASRFFVFANQLLTIESEQQQQSKLANPDAQDILDTAQNAAKEVLTLRHVIMN